MTQKNSHGLDGNWAGLVFFNLFAFKDFIYLFLERGEGREKEMKRNISVREKHWSVASGACPNQGPNLQPRHVPRQGIKTTTFHFVRWHPTNWATLGGAELDF